MIVLHIFDGDKPEGEFTPYAGDVQQMFFVMEMALAQRRAFRVLYDRATLNDYRRFVKQECLGRTFTALNEQRVVLLGKQFFHLRGTCLDSDDPVEAQADIDAQVYEMITAYHEMEMDVIVISDDEWGVTIDVVGDGSVQRDTCAFDSVAYLW